jgi:hypothetical protein
MHFRGGLLDQLVRESYEQNDLHLWLKRMVLQATESSLRKVSPDKYFEKCHGAAIAMFMILRTLRIRSMICGGTVSWLFGGIDATGANWQSRCGFWTPNPALPTPHAWLVTEFGSLVDLTCSYFPLAFAPRAPKNVQAFDTIPMIWMKTEYLSALPAVQYSAQAHFRNVDLDGCDDTAQQLVGRAVSSFWGNRLMMNLLESRPESRARALTEPPTLDEGILLDGPKRIDELKRSNAWVARNSRVPKSNGGVVFSVSG